MFGRLITWVRHRARPAGPDPPTSPLQTRPTCIRRLILSTLAKEESWQTQTVT